MTKAWGNDFTIVNDVYQPLPEPFQIKSKNKRYYHLATVKRGFKEYVAYVDPLKIMVWIEEADPKEPGLLKKIEDDNEWKDVRDFLWDAKLLEVGTRKEVPISFEAMRLLFKKNESA